VSPRKYNVTLGARSRNQLPGLKKKVLHILCVCVCVCVCLSLVLVIQHAMRMRRIIPSFVACMALQYFLHHLINGMIKINTERKVSSLSLELCQKQLTFQKISHLKNLTFKKLSHLKKSQISEKSRI